MAKQPKSKLVRVDEWTLKQLKNTLAEMISQTGDTNLKIGDVIEALLKEKRKAKENDN